VSPTVTALPGQETLLECWSALAQMSPGARLVRAPATVAAVFPSWAPLNNAIMLTADDGAASAAVSELSRVYGDAGVDVWALWVPSRARSLDGSDDVRVVGRLERDTTTLVMHATLEQGLRLHDGAVRTSIAAVTRVGNEAVAASELDEPDEMPGLAAWVMVHDDAAVASAWSFQHERDCGIYAVETVPRWRRRGFARALVEHALAHAQRRGAHTASLQSTQMGQYLYESLGFEPAGRYEEWISH
jgi:GNAT superfamily N-acetyltransferase